MRKRLALLVVVAGASLPAQLLRAAAENPFERPNPRLSRQLSGLLRDGAARAFSRRTGDFRAGGRLLLIGQPLSGFFTESWIGLDAQGQLHIAIRRRGRNVEGDLQRLDFERLAGILYAEAHRARAVRDKALLEICRSLPEAAGWGPIKRAWLGQVLLQARAQLPTILPGVDLSKIDRSNPELIHHLKLSKIRFAENNWIQHRKYDDDEIATLRALAGALGPDETWFDIGTGDGFIPVEYLAGGGKARVVGVGVTPPHDTSTIDRGLRDHPGRLSFLWGRPVEQIPPAALGRCELLSDMHAAFIYTPHLDRTLATYGRLIKPGGHLVVRGRLEATEIRDRQGRPIPLETWVERAGGFSDIRVADDRAELVARRTDEPVRPPPLILHSYAVVNVFPPPDRVFLTE